MPRTHSFYINIGYKILTKKFEILKVKKHVQNEQIWSKYNSKDERNLYYECIH